MLKITSIFARPKPYRIIMEEYKEDNLSQRMIEQIDELRSTIKENFQEFALKMSYAKGWIRSSWGDIICVATYATYYNNTFKTYAKDLTNHNFYCLFFS